ncbi:MAG TPA: hypothetical protein VIT88_08145 [Pyrinomonadaceae bacterium]
MSGLKLIIAALLLLVTASSYVAVSAQSPQAQTPGLPGLMIPARVVADPSVKAGWNRYEMGATPTLSLILPSKPDGTVEGVQGQIINTYVSVSSTAVYAAVRIDGLSTSLERAIEEARSRYFRSFFQGFARGFEKGLGPSITDKLELLEITQVPTATGQNGFQQRLTFGTAQGRAQMVFVGNSAFGLVALWFPNAPAGDVDSFFGSFRVK